MSEAERARNQLRLASAELLNKALEKHSEGMAHTRQATRLEQLATIGTDDIVIKLRDELVAQGLIEIFQVLNAPGADA